MSDLSIRVGDLHFGARWEPEAPRTIAAIRVLLPLRARLIHCRWSGESTWIPYGDLRPDVGWEHHTSHPGPGELALYPGGLSECEVFFPYGACTTSSKVGQLAANHFATIEPDEGWADRLREVGRRCLWDGAQEIEIVESRGVVTDLLVRGGIVVTAGGSGRADVAVEGGRIAAVEADLGGLAASAHHIVDASGLLVLPGVVDVHTHTRVATDERPDRFFDDSVAAAFGGTTTFLAFNNPGTGSSLAAARSLAIGLREWRAATAGDSAVDVAPSLVITAAMDDPAGEIPGAVEAGVPTFKAFMVYDFGLDDAAILRALEATGRHGGMLEVHCENDAIREALTARHLAAGETGPQYHATSRPPYVEAEATGRAIALARAARAPLYVVHLSSADALAEVRAARAEGLPVFAETCPAYLTLTEDVYAGDPEQASRFVISPPLRAPGHPEALWAGLADGSLSLVATDHVPDRFAVEKQSWRESFDRVSNGAPGIETLLPIVYDAGVAAGRISLERMVDLLSTTPARLFGFTSKGALAAGRDADIVLFDPAARRTIRGADLHHSSDYTPFEGREVRGAVRSTIVRGSFVVRDGAFVGRRGHGQFVERALAERSIGPLA